MKLLDCDKNLANSAEEDETTALMLAELLRCPKVVKKLLAAGADFTAKDKDGKTVLNIA